IHPVRLMAAEPEEKRLPFGPLSKEPLKIGCVVGRVDSLGGYAGVFFVVIFRSHGVLLPSGITPVARPPSFAGVSGKIAGRYQRVSEYREFLRKIAAMCACLLQLPDVAPGKDGCSGGTALGRGDKCIVEQ